MSEYTALQNHIDANLQTVLGRGKMFVLSERGSNSGRDGATPPACQQMMGQVSVPFLPDCGVMKR